MKVEEEKEVVLFKSSQVGLLFPRFHLLDIGPHPRPALGWMNLDLSIRCKNKQRFSDSTALEG